MKQWNKSSAFEQYYNTYPTNCPRSLQPQLVIKWPFADFWITFLLLLLARKLSFNFNWGEKRQTESDFFTKVWVLQNNVIIALHKMEFDDISLIDTFHLVFYLTILSEIASSHGNKYQKSIYYFSILALIAIKGALTPLCFMTLRQDNKYFFCYFCIPVKLAQSIRR